MIWFAIGAALVVGLYIVRVLGSPVLIQQTNYPIQGLIAAAIMGAVVPGTILWLIFG